MLCQARLVLPASLAREEKKATKAFLAHPCQDPVEGMEPRVPPDPQDLRDNPATPMASWSASRGLRATRALPGFQGSLD